MTKRCAGDLKCVGVQDVIFAVDLSASNVFAASTSGEDSAAGATSSSTTTSKATPALERHSHASQEKAKATQKFLASILKR
ncbi:unnamed protein product, partial [Amoebophrya sp. A25]|eukprot:GSA25T00010195001.1